MNKVMIKKDIKTIDLEELKYFFESNLYKGFKAKQVYEWIWKKGVNSFDLMSNLSLPEREFLKSNFIFNNIEIHQEHISKDKTRKYIFKLYDDNFVEGVLIPSKNRLTACISSQVGCKLNCSFCATGTMGFIRNLTAGEIFDQLNEINKKAIEIFNTPLSNVVLMGMGEPLLNYKEVCRFIDVVSSKEGFGMSQSRFTLSTVGLPKMIKKIADDNYKYNLAISLHSASDEKRADIIPFHSTISLKELKEALIYYNEKTNMIITLEYLMIKGVNDSKEDANDLLHFARGLKSKINLIPYNTVKDLKYKSSTELDITTFFDFLESKGQIVTKRMSKGQDIDGACGQLVIKNV